MDCLSDWSSIRQKQKGYRKSGPLAITFFSLALLNSNQISSLQSVHIPTISMLSLLKILTDNRLLHTARAMLRSKKMMSVAEVILKDNRLIRQEPNVRRFQFSLGTVLERYS